MAKKRLDTMASCRTYLANIIHEMDTGAISDNAGKSRGYIIKIIAEIIEGSALESRLEALERKMGVTK